MIPLQHKQNLPSPLPPSKKDSASHTHNTPFVVADCEALDQIEQEDHSDHHQQPTLLQTIQGHITQHNMKMLKESLRKQSVVKLSVDKDFAYLFEGSIHKPVREVETNMMFEVNQDEQRVCKWLQTDSVHAMARLEFSSYCRLLQMLEFKVEKLGIVVTNWHGYFSQKLEQLNSRRKIPLQWACLSSALDIDVKSKILELYELGKLKLLLISPQLFQNQEFHMFQCDLLTVFDIHLYGDNKPLLQKILAKTSPKRILGCHPYMTAPRIKQTTWENLGMSFNNQNHFLLRSTDKHKSLVQLLNKNNYERTLVLVPDFTTANQLSEVLSLQSLKTVNLCEVLPKWLINNFSLPRFLTKQIKKEAHLRKLLLKTQPAQIIVSVYFEGLRMLPQPNDLVVSYSMPTLDEYLVASSLGRQSCGIVCDEDYYRIRNQTSSTLIDASIADRLISELLEPINDKTKQKKHRRFFSQTLDQVMLKKFSVDRQIYASNDLRTLKCSKTCGDYQINRDQLQLMLESLQKCGAISRAMKNVGYECQIRATDVDRLKQLLPQAVLFNNKINLLNISNQVNMTTKQLIGLLGKNRINYSVSEEIIPYKVTNNKPQSISGEVIKTMQNIVYDRLKDIDVAYGIYCRSSYPSLEFMKKDKTAAKKNEFLTFVENYTEGKHQHCASQLPNARINNLRQLATHQKSIQQWLQSSDERINPHECVLFLQGITTPLTQKYASDNLFKSCYRYHYEDLLEVVHKIRGSKKVKLS